MSYNVAKESGVAVRRQTRRAIWVATAVGTTALGWLAGRRAHIDYLLMTPMGPHKITLAMVIAVTTGFRLAGWAAYGVLERFTSRARPLWITAALVVLGCSIALVYLLPAATQTRLTLTGLHCLAAIILIPGLPQTR